MGVFYSLPVNNEGTDGVLSYIMVFWVVCVCERGWGGETERKRKRNEWKGGCRGRKENSVVLTQAETFGIKGEFALKFSEMNYVKFGLKGDDRPIHLYMRSLWKKSSHCYYTRNGLHHIDVSWQPRRVDWSAHA